MKRLFIGLISAGLVLTGPAMADREDGVLRIAFSDPIESTDEVFDPKGETGFTNRAIHAALVSFDATSGGYTGHIAESFEAIDDTTWEFTLRDGLVFQDGSALTAEDVAYTINFLIDPEIQFRLKTRWAPFAGAEVVDDVTVRISTQRPYALTLARLASTPIWPSDAHAAVEDPATWGQVAIGAGPYRLASFDSDDGIVLQRWDGYQLGNLPEIETFEILPIPDSQSQMAEMMVGGIDVHIARQADLIAAMTASPTVAATATPGLQYIYVLLDAADRSGIGHLSDLRVRQAIFHAIDTDTIRTRVMAAGEQTERLARICQPNMAACPDGGGEPAFDPDRARALLAEAGLADGFDVEITTVGPVSRVAEAIAGYLREVGIRASVNTQTFAAYRRTQADGQINILVQNFGHGGLADAGQALTFYYGSPARDYAMDGAQRDRERGQRNARSGRADRALPLGL